MHNNDLRAARQMMPALTQQMLTMLAESLKGGQLQHTRKITQPDNHKRFRGFHTPAAGARYLGVPENAFRAAMRSMIGRGSLNVAKRRNGAVEAYSLTIDDVVSIGKSIPNGPFVKRAPTDPVLRIAIANQKGGVGKSVTTITPAVYLSTKLGLRVLIVDCDPQATSTRCFVPFLGEDDITVGQLVMNASNDGIDRKMLTKAAVKKTHVPNLHIIPGAERDTEAEHYLSQAITGGLGPNVHAALGDMLKTIESSYDVILIDSAPSNNLAALQAISAANALIIPIGADYCELDSTTNFVDFLNASYSALTEHAGFYFLKVLITRFEQSQRAVQGMIAADVGDTLMPVTFERAEAIGWATSQLSSIYEVDPVGMTSRERARLRDATITADATSKEVFELIRHCWPSQANSYSARMLSDETFIWTQIIAHVTATSQQEA